jgi:hypothetical protein
MGGKFCRCYSGKGAFHSMENFFAIFPRYEKYSPIFSTLWKIFGIFLEAIQAGGKRVLNRQRTSH